MAENTRGTPSQRPVHTAVATAAIGAAPVGALALMEATAAVGPVVLVAAAGTVGLLGARAVWRVRPVSAGRGLTGARSAGGLGRRSRGGGSLLGGLGRRRAGGRGAARNPLVASGVGAGRRRAAGGRGSRTGQPRSSATGTRAGRRGAGHSAHPPGGAHRRGAAAGGKRSKTSAGGSSSRRPFSSAAGSKPRTKGGKGGRSIGKRVAGGLGGFARRMFTPKPATVRSAVERNARNNAKDARRREKERIWRRIFGRRRTKKEAKRLKKLYKSRSWWERRAWIRVPVHSAARLWDVLAGVTLFGTATVLTGSVMWMRSASRVGNVVRGLHKESFAFLAIPFEGLGPDIRRLIDLLLTLLRRLFGRETKHADAATTRPTPEVIPTSPTSPEGATMGDSSLNGITTNLRPLIDAINEAGSLGGGEKPHATEVAKWHEDLQELVEALARRIAADAAIAAETLPVSGDAHEITTALGPATRSFADDIGEAGDAWKTANGTRYDRLVSEEAGEENWDLSTRPDR